MDSQQISLLDKPKKSTLSKTLWLLLSVAAVVSSTALIASYLIDHSSPHHFCEHALDTTSCSAHVSEVAQVPILTTTRKDHKFKLLQSFLMKSTSPIQKAMETANAIKLKVNNNNPREEASLRDCEQLMDLSMDRVWDSVMALTKESTNIDSLQDAHTWLSSVLTNHATCLDGLDGPPRALMEAQLEDLISRARTSLALLVAVLPPNINPKGEIMLKEILTHFRVYFTVLTKN